MAGASFTVSKDRGTVSICFQHRDAIERYTNSLIEVWIEMINNFFLSAPETPNESDPNDGSARSELPDNNQNDVGLDEAAGGFEEYDVGLSDVAKNEFGTVNVKPNEAADNADLAEDPLQEGVLAHFFAEFHGDEGENIVDETGTEDDTIKDETFNLIMLRVSLDADEQNESDQSDCVITSAYICAFEDIWSWINAN